MPHLTDGEKARIVEEQQLRNRENLKTGVKTLGKMYVVSIGLAIIVVCGACACSALVLARASGHLNSLGCRPAREGP